MGKYIVLEVGDSAYGRYLTKSGFFEDSEDSVVIDILDASSEDDAICSALAKDQCKDRVYDMVVAYELKG
jgi:hypothetical protein